MRVVKEADNDPHENLKSLSEKSFDQDTDEEVDELLENIQIFDE